MVIGVEIDWRAFYAHERRRRVPLPTYPFERERYWIEPKEPMFGTSAKAARADRKSDIADWFYLPMWKPTLAPRLRAEAFTERKTWLLFVAETDELGVQLAQRLIGLGQTVISVQPGAITQQIDAAHWSIDPRDPAAYETLLKEQRPDRILHLWSCAPTDRSVAAIRERGYLSVLYLAQALGQQNITTPLPLQIVTTQAQTVSATDPIEPEKAAVLGLCKVIPQEYFNLKCQCLDVERSTSMTRLIDQILAESSADPVVAYRGQQRFVQTFEAVHLEAGPARLRARGVYLITGGLGNVGYAFAEALAKQVQARLVLIGRTELPPRDQWQAWLAAHAATDAISTKIHKVQALEQLGAEVWVVSADVAQAASLRTAIEQARTKWGAVQGVIHAAGTIDAQLFRAIRDTQAADAVQHFPAKVQGVQALEEALRDQTLDFCLLTSSLSAVLGGLGLAAYAAANAYLDAFAQCHNQNASTLWMSVDWDGWQITADQAHAQTGNPPAHLAITADEGGEALRRLLSIAPVPHMVISTSSLPARLEQWVKPQAQSEVAPQTNKAVVQMARPNLQTAYVAPRTEMEQRIAQVWQNVLGLEQVGVYDSFFELGGNSLAGVQAIAQLNAVLGVQIPTVSLYESPTINALAKLIEQQMGAVQLEEPAYEAQRSRGERRRARVQQRRAA